LASRGFVLAPLAELDPRFRGALDALRDPHAVRLYSAPR
jgi:7,8-dihydro-6-hydroxymethylpterin-pyrophosphokinase